MARRGAVKEAANDTPRMELKTVVDNRTVGEILREARVARDEDYVHVCEQLRIRRTYMQAIEEGRFGDLPGSTYAIGFVRTYSEYLGLDVAKMVAKYKQEASDFEDQTKLVFPEPMPASRGPTASIIVAAVVLLFGSYAGWLYISNKDRDEIALVPPLPEALQQLLPLGGVAEESPQDAAQAPAGDSPSAQPATAPQPQPQTSPSEEVAVQTEAQSDPEPEAPVAETAPVTESQGTLAVVDETIASAVTAVDEAVQAVDEPVVEPETAPAVTEAPTVEAEGVETQVSAAVTQPAENEATPEVVVSDAPPTPTVEQEVPVASAVETVTSIPAPVSDAVVVTQPEAGVTDEAPAVDQQSESIAIPEPASDVENAVETEVAVAQPAPIESLAVPVPDTVEPTSYGDDSSSSRILIRSTSAAWVEITEEGGNVLLTRLLRPGDSFRVPDRPGITLVTGNAGGLEFVVDGRAAPAIGAIGDVRRDVALEPNALLQGTAAAEN